MLRRSERPDPLVGWCVVVIVALALLQVALVVLAACGMVALHG